jgi:hypothetical protein
VSNDKTYYALLGNKLGIEMFAYGCGGYGTLQEFLVLDRYIDSIKPDVIIWQFCFNDFVNNDVYLEMASTRNNNGMTRPYWINGKVEYLLPKGKVERTVRSVFGWSRLVGFLFNRIDKLKATNTDVSIEAVLAKEGMHHSGFSRSLKTTDEILAKVQQRSGAARIVGFYVNGLRPAEDSPAKSEFRSLCEKHGFSFVESAAAVEEAERRGEIVRYADGAHWNDRGHALAAGLLVEVLSTIIKDKQFGKE